MTKIVVGLDDNSPPMGFRDEKNELVGFDIDMAKEAATKIALDNVALIPLHFESSIWAFRKGLTYEGRRDQYTLATSVKGK